MKLRGFAGECNRLGQLLSEGSTCGPFVLGTNSAAGTQLSVLSSADPFSQAQISFTRCVLELIVEGLLSDAREVTCQWLHGW